jgi:DNA-binding MarR family transcriptional regulator
MVGWAATTGICRVKNPKATEKAQYKARADFRYLVRKFLAFSDEAARSVNLTTRQHEALLAIMGAGHDLTIGDLADCLVIKHHSAVGLVDRLEKAGLVLRKAHSRNHREVVICLKPRAKKLLKALSDSHLEEWRKLAPLLQSALRALS